MLAHRFQTGRCVVLLHPLGSSSSGTDYAIPPCQLARDEHQRGTNPNTAQISLVVESQSPRPHPGPSESACSIRVSTRGFLRLWRIVRKRESVKFFVFNNRQWCESHPLRHPINHSHIIVCGVVSPVLRLSEKLDTCGTRAREGDLLRSQRTAEIGGREIAEAWKRAVGEKSFVEVPRGAARRM
jgi:hypothetical protein